MAPIRIALIGLSQAAKTSWASGGHLPYLQSERGKSRYKIVALLNSSEDAAKKAIQAYDLPSDVRAYGSPGDLAADKDVDFVVCTTRVDVHYDTIKPSVEAGKNVYVEWPLAENVTRAGDLADAVKKSGSKTVIGLQSRVAPAVLKIKELVQKGTIGRVVSSDLVAFTPGGGGFSISEGLGYFLDRKVGGNPVTIAFGHVIDAIHFVLGEYKAFDAHTQIERPNQKIVNRETGQERETTSDVPDLVSLQGPLTPSQMVTEGASLTVTFRSGPPFPGSKALVWTITGEKGRIRLSNEKTSFVQMEADANAMPIEVESFSSGEVTKASWGWEDWQEPLLARGRNIAKLYDLYYEGKLGEFGAADFDAAVVRHQELDKILYG